MTDATTPQNRSVRGIFVTGTDTNVGKTVVTAALGLALRRQGLDIGVMKPIETGVRLNATHVGSDSHRLQQLLSPQNAVHVINPYQFPDPLAPLEAARLTGRNISLQEIQHNFLALAERHPFMLVEGIGGVMVPVTENHDVRDLIQCLDIPCLIVSRASLGAINHTRLTLEALQHVGLKVSAIVLNHPTLPSDSRDADLQTESTIQLIRRSSMVPVVGPLRFEEDLGNDWKHGVAQLSDDRVIAQLVEIVTESVWQMP